MLTRGDIFDLVQCSKLYVELGVPTMEPHTTFIVKGIVKVDVPTSNINKFGDLYWSGMCKSNNGHQKNMC
jgi:hypothetical protein